jgi:hypothetical protein
MSEFPLEVRDEIAERRKSEDGGRMFLSELCGKFSTAKSAENAKVL